MREICAFLDDEDPQVQQALAVLGALLAQGHTTEQVVTRALVQLAEGGPMPESAAISIVSVKDMIHQLRDLLEEIRAMGLATNATVVQVPAGPNPPAPAADEGGDEIKLPATFLAAVKKAARPGVKLET
jgi:hypothetical protein